ncbi:MAG: diguanylate cyclase [Desulfobacula sp.]|nr:diguanylate cyclase [Desulfobacula sp.]
MKHRRDKLIIIVSLLLVAGFMASSLASYYTARASLRSQIKHKHLPLTSDNIYSEIQRDLLPPICISSLMANDTFLKEWIVQGENDKEKITRYLKEIQKKYNTITSFFVSEKTRIYYHANGILKKVDQENESDKWYFRVRSMEADYEINVDPDMANNESMTVFINYRIYDEKNNFSGATGVGLAVTAVKKLIEKYQKDYDRNIYFSDDNGNIQLNGSDLSNRVRNISQIKGISSFAKEILSKKHHYFQYKKNETTIHLNIRYLPKLKWFLFVEQAEKKMIEIIFNTLIANLAACAVIAIIVVFLTTLTISSFQAKLEKMASTDGLTGIYNRHSFDIIMNQAIKSRQRKSLDLSIISFDIDHFKKINDQFGHPAGDLVIKNIVLEAQNIIRDSDAFCRWGGEEFLILLKECSLDDAYLIAEKIRKAVFNASIVYKGEKIFATISLGIAHYHSDEDQAALLNKVDKLLYFAKENGRNRSEKETPSV